MDYREDIRLLSKGPILRSLCHSTSLNIQLIRLCPCRLLLFDYYLDLIQLDCFCCCCCCCHSRHYSSNTDIFEGSELFGLLLEDIVPCLTHPLLHTAVLVYRPL